MGQITATRNLVATKVVRHAGQSSVDNYNDAIMGAMASQITSLASVYSTVYTGTDQRKHEKLCVTGLCEGNSPVTGEFPRKKGQWHGKCFHLMTSSWTIKKEWWIKDRLFKIRTIGTYGWFGQPIDTSTILWLRVQKHVKPSSKSHTIPLCTEACV